MGIREASRGDPVKFIERRAKLRAGFFQYMAAHDNEYGIHGEAIIGNLRRFDSVRIKSRDSEIPWFS